MQCCISHDKHAHMNVPLCAQATAAGDRNEHRVNIWPILNPCAFRKRMRNHGVCTVFGVKALDVGRDGGLEAWECPLPEVVRGL